MTEQPGLIFSILPYINSPADVAVLESTDLVRLAEELRQTIITTVSATGGHLAPSLGVVELTLALAKAFHFDGNKADRLIWDVGHQAYAWKLLTGRRDVFSTLRTLGGISGFPKMTESPYDYFGVGHSSTSISAALGLAMGRDLNAKQNHVIAIIGDGSMTAGLAFEGLNQAGHMGRKILVVLNDNEMSISRNVGALSSFLSRKMSHRWIKRFKREAEYWLKHIPAVGDDMAEYLRRSEASFKSFVTPGMLFEAFHFNYLGPIDGHNLDQLVDVFEQVRHLDGAHLVHVLTRKGKGYGPAESNPTYFHGVGCFEPETGNAQKILDAIQLPTYTEVFGQTLCQLAATDLTIVAITAAMPEGTGLVCFSERFPERFVDVGICEQHAVTFAAGLALEGYKPVVAIYSTFLQRSYDQIVHDVCLQGLDVTFCLDRGGLVGEDGPTHHGAFDFSFLRHIPGLMLMAPRDEVELQDLLITAIAHPGPAAIRYPRGVGIGRQLRKMPRLMSIGEGELLRRGKDGIIVAIGSRVHPSLTAADELAVEQGLELAVFDARFVKPLPVTQLLDLTCRFDRWVLVEENVLAGGFSSAVLELMADRNLLVTGKHICRVGLPDAFVEHGAQQAIRQRLGLDKDGIKRAALALFRQYPA
ncbi:1-deoxy-D-xylulose-5-phosphate synthase [Desulfovibrionales bacterium]